MNGLEAQFGDRLDFVWLNVDDPGTLPMRQQFDIVRRTSYVLVDAEGAVIQRWFGYLNEAEVAGAISDWLAAQ